eukprot:gb/GFBE01069544.1/.p1 GENE.gb/GFBE01069544.1/~~gb/GFBE01069544.1/.p1  ORF type:complete len:650 (+),score=137.81 gb/GFBE01069544.1/:1-1950(+)
MGSTGEILPGQFSPIGRLTELDLRKLKENVKAGDEELLSVNIPKEPRPEPPPPGPTADDLLASNLRSPHGKKLGFTSTLKESSFSRSMKEKLMSSMSESAAGGLSDDRVAAPEDADFGKSTLNLTSASAGLESPSASPTTEKPTSSFTTSAKPALEREQMCEIARELHGRYMHPASLDLKPPLGHYHVNEAAVFDRYPEWEFGEREKHLPIKPREVDTGMEPGEAFSSFGNPFSRSSGLEQMRLASKRPDPWTSITFASEYAKEWAQRDAYSTIRDRYPDWDLKKHSGSHAVESLKTCQYFEPAKYKVNLDMIAPVPKSGVPYNRAMGRSQTDSKLAPKAILIPPKKALVADRSRFRGCSASVPRKTCIQDFGKDLDRPPLTTAAKEYYDEADPVASAKVFQQQMSFDASSADNYIITRKDHAPDMHTCMGRKKAGMGSRIFQNHPLGLRHTMGVGFTTTSVDECPAETLEAPSLERRDLGMSLKQMKGRYNAPAPIATRIHSRLGQPSGTKTFDFARTSKKGFTSGSSPSQLAAARRARSQTRLHEAFPAWDLVSYDEAEGRPMPSAPPLKTGTGFSISAMDRRELLASYQAFCQGSEGQMLSQEEFNELLRLKAPKLHLMVSAGETGAEAVATLREQFEQAQRKLAS